MTPESIQTRGLGNPNGGIDDLGTKVGKGSHCDHGRKRNDPLAFPVVVGQHARSVSGESEPGAVATIRLPMLIGCRRSSPEARMIALEVAG